MVAEKIGAIQMFSKVFIQKHSTSKDVPIADRGELEQAALISYGYLPKFWHKLTIYSDQLYSISKYVFKVVPIPNRA